MKQKDKELLLKDLSSRLPYGVICADKYVDEKFINKWNVLAIDATFGNKLSQVCISNCEVTYGYKTSIANIKPYLFPLSSMTEEQKEEYRKACDLDTEILSKHPMDGTPFPALHNSQDWLNAHHFDYRGLIPMGLANNATGLNIY